MFFFDTLTGTYTIPSDWKIGGTEVFSHSLNLCTGTLDSTDGTDHTYKYIEFPSRPTFPRERTELWTNPSPSSSYAAATVTLKQSINNFTFLEFTACPINTETSTTLKIIVYTSEFKLTQKANNKMTVCMYGNSIGFRYFLYNTDTKIDIGPGTRYSSSGSGTYNTNVIPISIYGLN